MKTIETTVYEQEDIEAIIDARIQPFADWSLSVTDSINELSAIITTLEDVNTKQNKRINALKSRVTALEEQIASGVYSDVY
jgi:uncharacterized coiled-coil protein SlyX